MPTEPTPPQEGTYDWFAAIAALLQLSALLFVIIAPFVLCNDPYTSKQYQQACEHNERRADSLQQELSLLQAILKTHRSEPSDSTGITLDSVEIK